MSSTLQNSLIYKKVRDGPLYAHITCCSFHSATEGHAGDFHLLPAMHSLLLETCMCKNLFKAQLSCWCMHIVKLYGHSLNFWWEHALKKHNQSSVTHIKPNSLMGHALQITSTSIYWHLSFVDLWICLCASTYLPTSLWCAEISASPVVPILFSKRRHIGRGATKGGSWGRVVCSLWAIASKAIKGCWK